MSEAQHVFNICPRTQVHGHHGYNRDKQVLWCMLPVWASSRISSLFVTTKLGGGTCQWSSRQEIKTWIKKQINWPVCLYMCACGWVGGCMCFCARMLLTPTDHLIEQLSLGKHYMHFASCNISVRDQIHTQETTSTSHTHQTLSQNVILKRCKQMQNNPQVLTGCDPADSFKHCSNNVKGWLLRVLTCHPSAYVF